MSGERYWYAYVPLHVAGSGGNRLIGKFQATADAVRETFGDSATINYQNGVIECYKRPSLGRNRP